MRHPSHTHPRRLSAFKIALFSILPLLNQMVPTVWLVRNETRMAAHASNNLLSLDAVPHYQLHRLLLEGKQKPRVFYLELGDENEEHKFDVLLKPHPNIELEFQDREPPEYAQPKPHLCYGYPKNECKVPGGGAWQKANFPSCNSLHEIDLPLALTSNSPTAINAKLVGQGGKRLVWKIKDTASLLPYSTINVTSAVALKMFKYRKDRDQDFGPLSLDFQRRDAVIHQATAASPYIVNIHGFCGASALYDFADGGDLQHNIDKKGALQGENLLKTAYQLAAGLKDLHQVHMGKNRTPSVAHADIYGSQWVKVKGRYRLTDFNLAKFLVKNKTTAEVLSFRRDVVDNVSSDGDQSSTKSLFC